MPKVSVIIPAYNAARYLPTAIDSVLAQTCQDYELILVDDGSTDDTRAVAAHYGVRVNYVHQANQGVGAARNAGLDQARGDYLVFQDADDVLLPCKLEVQAAFLDRHPDVAAVFSDICQFWLDAAGQERRQAYPSTARLKQALNEPARAREILLIQNIFPPIAAMVRRGCIQDIGGFDPDRALMSLEDWDLWYRLAQDYRFAYHAGLVAHYRLAENSLSKNPQTVKRASEVLERKIEQSSAFTTFSARARSAFYFYWGVLWLEYSEPARAITRFRRASQINRRNIYARSAYWLTQLLGQRAVVFFHLKRRLFGLRQIPGV